MSSLTGSAKALRIDGNEFNLSNGDPIFQGDTIVVSEKGAVGLVFLDKTTYFLNYLFSKVIFYFISVEQ